MANPHYWVRRVRRARRDFGEDSGREGRVRGNRRRERPRPGRRFEGYESAYREVLESIDHLAGEDAVDELGRWMLESTRRERTLPDPDAVRERARQLCARREIELPENSSLAP